MANSFDGRSFFSERLMRKVPGAAQIVLSALIVVVAGAICIAAFFLLRTLAIVIWAAAVFAAYYAVNTIMVKEVEYILTDSALDIDIITAKRSRKRLKSINLKECTKGGKYTGEQEGEFLCPSKNSDNLYYLERKNKGTLETVIIDPNEMMKDAFKYYMGKSFEI